MITQISETSFYLDTVFYDLIAIKARIMANSSIALVHVQGLWYTSIREGYRTRNEIRIRIATRELAKLGIVID